MTSKRKAQSDVEKTHGHCADVLMDDYGIPKSMRKEVCEEIAKLWRQNTMIHCIIITSIRGWHPVAGTNGLKYFLIERQTHEPRNHKPA